MSVVKKLIYMVKKIKKIKKICYMNSNSMCYILWNKTSKIHDI